MIVIVGSMPPIEIVPVVLLPTITAVAPASCAFFTLKVKPQPPPRSTNAIRPVKKPGANGWHASVVVPGVTVPGNGSVEPSFPSLTLPVICVAEVINGLKVPGSDALLPAIAAGELTAVTAVWLPQSTMFATLIARAD